MLTLTVPDMSCAHCVSTVTKTLHGLDAAAVVSIDLPSHTVAVETKADAASVLRALDGAGYPGTLA